MTEDETINQGEEDMDNIVEEEQSRIEEVEASETKPSDQNIAVIDVTEAELESSLETISEEDVLDHELPDSNAITEAKAQNEEERISKPGVNDMAVEPITDEQEVEDYTESEEIITAEDTGLKEDESELIGEVEVEEIGQEQEIEERDQEKLPWWKRLIAPVQRKTEPQPEKEAEEYTESEELITVEDTELKEDESELIGEVEVEEVFDQEQETEEGDQEKHTWWKRLVTPFQRKTEPQPEKEISPLEEPSAADTEEPVAPKVFIAESEEPALMPVQEIAAPIVGEPVVSIDEEIIPERKEEITTTEPPITEDHVRSLVQEEISRTQSDLSRLVQAEFAREQENRRRTTMETAQDFVELVYVSKAETLRLEIEALRNEESIILQDRKRPLRERYEDIDFIRDRSEKLEHEAAELEKETTLHAAEAEQSLAELEGRGVVADFRSELERQKAVMDKIPRLVNVEVDQRIASSRSKNYTGMGLWTILLGLLLILAVGMAGILLPRQSNNDLSNMIVELATLYQVAGHSEDSNRLLDEVDVSSIKDIGVLGRVGELYRVLDQPEDAIRVLRRVLKTDPENTDYLFSLARSYAAAGYPQEAISTFEELISLEPNNPWYFAEIGHIYKTQKDYEMAISQYETMLEINPNLWESYHFQGGVYLEQKKYDQAIDAFKKAIEFNPNSHYETWLFAGTSYAGNDNFDEAIQHYQAAIELSPERPETYYYLGETFQSLERFGEAIEAYEKAININRKYTNAYIGMGKVYLSLDKCNDAIQQFKIALELSPNNRDALIGLQACADK